MRIKLDFSAIGDPERLLKLNNLHQWSLIKLQSVKTILDLKKHIVAKHFKSIDLVKAESALEVYLEEPYVLPNWESSAILNDNDTITIKIVSKPPPKLNGVKRKAESSSSESSSTDEDDDNDKTVPEIKKAKKVVVEKSSSDTSSSESSSDSENENVEPVKSVKNANQNGNGGVDSSVSSDDEDELTFEKPFKKINPDWSRLSSSTPTTTNGDPTPLNNGASKIVNGDEKDGNKPKKKRRRRKNKNKNKIGDEVGEAPTRLLPEQDPVEPEKEPFTAYDSDSIPGFKKIVGKSRGLEKSSADVSCEDFLLGQIGEGGDAPSKNHINDCSVSYVSSPKVKKSTPKPSTSNNFVQYLKNTTATPPSEASSSNTNNGLEALLNLANSSKPIISSKKNIKADDKESAKWKNVAKNDVQTNRSVILKNSQTFDFDADNLDGYDLIKGANVEPVVGQKIAFKNLQMTPDFTPNLVQLVGEVLSFDAGQVKFKILYDETDGVERVTKFDINEPDQDQDGNTKTEMSFQWCTLQEKRLIQ